MRYLYTLFVILVLAVMFTATTPALAFTAPSCGDPGSISATTLCNPTAKFAPNLPSFITNILKVFGMAVGLQAIIYVVFAGFKMVISQGNSEEVATAKASLQWALLGMILIFSSFALVYAVSVFLGTTDVNKDISNPVRDDVTNPTRANNFLELIMNILNGFLGIAGLIALLMIIINGLRYVFSGGNNEQTESAKSGLQWAVIGLMVITLAYAIVRATAKLLPGGS